MFRPRSSQAPLCHRPRRLRRASGPYTRASVLQVTSSRRRVTLPEQIGQVSGSVFHRLGVRCCGLHRLPLETDLPWRCPRPCLQDRGQGGPACRTALRVLEETSPRWSGVGRRVAAACNFGPFRSAVGPDRRAPRMRPRPAAGKGRARSRGAQRFHQRFFSITAKAASRALRSNVSSGEAQWRREETLLTVGSVVKSAGAVNAGWVRSFGSAAGPGPPWRAG